MTSALCFTGSTSLLEFLTSRIMTGLFLIGGSSIVSRIVCYDTGSEGKIVMSSSLVGCLECFAGLVSTLDELL